ncbi:MAG: copper amine oxidase N-terminal domain-containing protein [Eubacteriales bacterium]|nr:copper amine oxidase N-terminal domain-containing protein [Eubacteriales bacterium]
MKRFIKIFCSGILAGSMLLSSLTVFAESSTASKWIFDKRGSIIVDTEKNPILRESLSFGNSGVEVFDGDGNSLGKVNLERKDLYVNGTDVLLDFPNETNPPTNNGQGITVRVPIEPLYSGTTNNTITSNTVTASNTATDFYGNLRMLLNSGFAKVTIGSKIANVNGQNVTMDVAPYIQKESSSTMIPLRFVAIALGIDENDISFDTVTKTITIIDKKYSNEIKFFVNSNEYYFNRYISSRENGPIVEIKNGRTFIPLITLKDAFNTIDRNVYTDWEPTTKTAIIKFEELGEKITSTNNTTNNTTNNNITNNTTQQIQHNQ